MYASDSGLISNQKCVKRRIGMIKHLHVLAILVALFCASTSTWAGVKDSDLITAAGKGNLPRVKALLAAKTNVNAKTDNGVTALIAASENGHEEVVVALLAAKADVNAAANDGGYGK